VSTFEIHVYKSGNWNVDSYFDDRDLAMSEAERLEGSGRYAGVRILQEDYDATSNKSNCRVVFSKIRQSGENQKWREQAKRDSTVRTDARKSDNARPGPSRKQPESKGSTTSLYIGIIVALVVLIAGAAAMIGLQEIVKYL
jgi:hypothetical protein